MKAFIFSIGEPTTDTCEWSLRRLGFETILYQDDSSLWSKLKRLYAETDEDFIRTDADIIVNKNVLKLKPEDDCWWHQSYGWDWHKQELSPISVSYIKKELLPYARANIHKFEHSERPESQIFRLPELHNPRRCEVYNLVTGLHGYKANDLSRIKEQKNRRKQEYDWELTERISEL